MDKWSNAQSHEAHFWGTCTQTFIEEQKQFFYATRMKLPFIDYPLSSIDFQGKSVIDIGAGPTSLLLKSHNYSKAVAVDPLMDTFPSWVRDRYLSVGIKPVCSGGEDFQTDERFDIVLCMNVLQHVVDPVKMVSNMRKIGKEVRSYEWINIPSDSLHPHVLEEHKLNEWFGGKGIVEAVHEPYMFDGSCWYGVFPGYKNI